MPPSHGLTHYEVLEVLESATEAEITSAYRQLANEYHPDRLPPDLRARRIGRDALEKFRQVLEAYTVLSDRKSRTKYDSTLAESRDVFVPERSTSAPPSSRRPPPARGSRPSRRNPGRKAITASFGAAAVVGALAAFLVGAARDPEPTLTQFADGSVASIEPSVEELVNAAEVGDEKKLDALLASGVNPNSISTQTRNAFSSRVSALSVAVLAGRTKIVRMLLRAGAHPNAPGTHGGSALADAMAARHDSLVTLLRSAGAYLPPNSASLVAAAAGGYLADVRTLVDRGVDVNAGAGYKGSTRALSVAAFGGHAAIVELLLSRGARIDIPDEDRQTALDYARRRGDPAIIEMLTAAAGKGKEN
ncbi:MAG: DnaJ domain-containing protein [bacterium]